jgi:hypothetical protein
VVFAILVWGRRKISTKYKVRSTNGTALQCGIRTLYFVLLLLTYIIILGSFSVRPCWHRIRTVISRHNQDPMGRKQSVKPHGGGEPAKGRSPRKAEKWAVRTEAVSHTIEANDLLRQLLKREEERE